jgi:hypothetical protein
MCRDVHVPLVADVPKQALLKGPIPPRGTLVPRRSEECICLVFSVYEWIVLYPA